MSLQNLKRRLESLDELIMVLTHPPITAKLRNQVWLVIQEFEAVIADVEAIAQDVKVVKAGSDQQLIQIAELKKLVSEMKVKYGG